MLCQLHEAGCVRRRRLIVKVDHLISVSLPDGVQCVPERLQQADEHARKLPVFVLGSDHTHFLDLCGWKGSESEDSQSKKMTPAEMPVSVLLRLPDG